MQAKERDKAIDLTMVRHTPSDKDHSFLVKNQKNYCQVLSSSKDTRFLEVVFTRPTEAGSIQLIYTAVDLDPDTVPIMGIGPLVHQGFETKSTLTVCKKRKEQELNCGGI